MQITKINEDRQTFAKRLKGVGVEVGVERGIFSEMVLQNPDTKLYCVDPWLAYKGYRDHVSQDKLDGFYEQTKEKLSKYNCEIIRKTSMEAVKDFEDESLDFVYIDANHNFENVAMDLIHWMKKVKKGGIVSGHDYVKRKGERYINHTVDVINAYANAYGIEVLVFNDSSWLWIKQ